MKDLLIDYDAVGLGQLIHKKEISPMELLEATIERIEACDLKILVDIERSIGERPSNEIVSSYSQAVAMADELGMHPLVAHCHRGLGFYTDAMGRRTLSNFFSCILIDFS